MFCGVGKERKNGSTAYSRPTSGCLPLRASDYPCAFVWFESTPIHLTSQTATSTNKTSQKGFFFSIHSHCDSSSLETVFRNSDMAASSVGSSLFCLSNGPRLDDDFAIAVFAHHLTMSLERQNKQRGMSAVTTAPKVTILFRGAGKGLTPTA